MGQKRCQQGAWDRGCCGQQNNGKGKRKEFGVLHGKDAQDGNGEPNITKGRSGGGKIGKDESKERKIWGRLHKECEGGEGVSGGMLGIHSVGKNIS